MQFAFLYTEHDMVDDYLHKVGGVMKCSR